MVRLLDKLIDGVFSQGFATTVIIAMLIAGALLAPRAGCVKARGSEPAARARAALALASVGATGCGVCRTDYERCFAEAAESGRPLVVMVGSACDSRGHELVGTGAILCRRGEFTFDAEANKAKPRIVVLAQNHRTHGLAIQETLPPDADTAAVVRAIEAAAVKGGVVPPSRIAPNPRPKGVKLSWE